MGDIQAGVAGRSGETRDTALLGLDHLVIDRTGRDARPAHRQKDQGVKIADKTRISTDQRLRHSVTMWIAVGLIFVLGVANFALHRAVVESGHALLAQMPGFVTGLGRRLALVAEFLVLLAAMALAANGWTSFAFAYLAYSALNAIAGWLILSGRI